MLIGQIYFFLKRTLEPIKIITYKKIFMDFEKSDAGSDYSKKFFWIFEKSDVGRSRIPKFFCPRPYNKLNFYSKFICVTLY